MDLFWGSSLCCEGRRKAYNAGPAGTANAFAGRNICAYRGSLGEAWYSWRSLVSVLVEEPVFKCPVLSAVSCKPYGCLVDPLIERTSSAVRFETCIVPLVCTLSNERNRLLILPRACVAPPVAVGIGIELNGAEVILRHARIRRSHSSCAENI